MTHVVVTIKVDPFHSKIERHEFLANPYNPCWRLYLECGHSRRVMATRHNPTEGGRMNVPAPTGTIHCIACRIAKRGHPRKKKA